MTSWINFAPDPVSGLKLLSTYGEVATNSPSFVIPSGAIYTEALPLPVPLNGIVDNWSEAFDYQLNQFYRADNDLNLFLKPITNWYQLGTLYGEEEINWVKINFTGMQALYYQLTPQLQSLLNVGYPGKEVQAPLTWEQIQERGVTIINELTPWVNSAVITGTPVDPSVVAVQEVAANPQGYYTSPYQAAPYFRLGAAGVALNLGEPWPPAIPD